MEHRLVDLEIRYTHLERQLAELNQVVFDQQKTIGEMARQIAALRARVGDLGEEPPVEKPPHF
jgi:uncharacterized coiled-coil protein SlyX